jgi:hypothetical protein
MFHHASLSSPIPFLRPPLCAVSLVRFRFILALAPRFSFSFFFLSLFLVQSFSSVFFSFFSSLC